MTNRKREGGFRGASTIALPNDRGADAPLRAAGRESSMRFTRRRSDRSGSVRRKHVSYPEALESRLVLSTAIPSSLSPWIPSDLPVENPITHQKELLLAQRLN